LGADRGNHLQSFARLSPRAPGHGSRIVNQKDGVEGLEKCILVVIFWGSRYV
jgi:hypothetical protein